MTAAAIAAEAGVDDFIAEATPETKLEAIRQYQAEGHMVAMTGDGTNDAPALAQADVAVAMNSGTQAAKEAGNMVDLDSSPTKLIDIVRIGKQLLMTRGSLTTFSIANDVAKYFAIIPALFVPLYPQLEALNIMHLASPASAVMAAIIYNALIIVAFDSACASRREVSRGVFAKPSDQKPSGLRPWRHHLAVRGHQVARHADGSHRRRLARFCSCAGAAFAKRPARGVLGGPAL